MRIALTYPEASLTGGVERHFVHAANHLAGRGHEVHAFAATFADGVLDDAVVRHPVRVPSRPDPAFALAFRNRSTAALDAAGPFDVHGSFSALSPLGGVYWAPSVHLAAYREALARRSPAARLVQQVNPYHRVRLRFERQVLSAGGYARVIAYAPTVASDFMSLYGVPAEDIEQLPLGVDVASFSPARRAELRAQARARHGFAAEDRVVVFVANELERKGFDTLLRAARELDGVRLLVVGRVDPSGYAELRGNVDVTFTGSSADVPAELAAADAFALPTRYEPWGLVIVEALATGLPVVTTRLAGAAQAVDDGRTGVLLDDAGDARALADGLRWALNGHRPSAEEIAASVQRYSWEQVLDRYEAVLAEVAERARTAATGGPAKTPGYYGALRPDLVAELPRPLGRVLDVGCGAGGVGRSLRAAGAAELVGIEVVPEAAEKAREVFDEVVVGTVEEALAGGAVQGPFDTICCYDVLEHLVDPEDVLRALLPLAAPGGRLHVSCPNARHFSLVRDLVLRGTFGYTEYGHRDTTHLRWFTRKDLVAAAERAGWRVTAVRPNAFRGKDRPADRLTLGRAREFLALQWHVLAVAP